MTTQTAVYVIEALLCGGVLIWFFSRPWQNLCISALRQQLFELRDQLFLLGADGRIEFTDPAYVYLRRYFDTCLRFAHHDIFSELVAGMAALNTKDAARPEMIGLIDGVVDVETRQKLRSILYQSMVVRVVYMLLRSPVVVLPVVVIAAVSAARVAVVRRLLPRMVSTLETGNRDNIGDGGTTKDLRPA